MPNDTLQTIRGIERKTGRHVPAIAVTAHALKEERERLLQEGFDGYLPKPVNFQELKDVLEQILAGHYVLP